MPRSRWKVCSFPGCPELVAGATRCTIHTARADDSYRPSARQRGYDSRWTAFRAKYIAAHPTCIVVDCGAKAKDVDHIDGLGPLGPRGYDETNLRSLCHPHHSAITAATTWAKRNGSTAPQGVGVPPRSSLAPSREGLSDAGRCMPVSSFAEAG